MCVAVYDMCHIDIDFYFYFLLKNTCRTPYLDMSAKSFTVATIIIASFSASEQANCALVEYDSE